MGDSAPQIGVQPWIGITLLVLSDSVEFGGIVRALKVRGLRPVIIPRDEGTLAVVLRWRPQAVVLQAGRADWLALLGLLGRRGIPCVLLGTSAQLRRAEKYGARCVQLLVPVEPDEIAQGAQLVVGPPASGGLPSSIDLGIVKIDVRAREVEVEGTRRALPPKEFEILVQLARQPGVPLGAAELLDRVWPGSDSATVDDLHTRIWRLRKMIGDHERRRPLIVNRRGYGYLLDVPPARSG